MPQEIMTAEASLSRQALVFGLVLLCLDIGSKMVFGVLDPQSCFSINGDASFVRLVMLWPSVPLVLALLWQRGLVARCGPTMYRFAVAALAVGGLGGFFSWLYFDRAMHLAAPALGVHFFNTTLSEGSTILASLTLLGGAIIGRRAPR
jgi:hypothetical protein